MCGKTRRNGVKNEQVLNICEMNTKVSEQNERNALK